MKGGSARIWAFWSRAWMAIRGQLFPLALLIAAGVSLQHLTGWPVSRSRDLASIREDAGSSYRGGLPHPVTRVAVFEDGIALRWSMSRDRVQEEPGIFNYKPGSKSVYFSASDGSDPRKNGRSYRVRYGARVPPGLLAGVWGCALAFSVAAALRLRRRLGAAGAAWCMWLTIAALAGAKLVVTSSDEIVSTVGTDEVTYAYLSIRPPWDCEGLPSHPGGFPALVALVRAVGLPYRVGLEFAYLGLSLLAALRFGRIAGTRASIVALFGVLAWHPWTLNRFCVFMPEPVVLLCSVLLCSAFWGWLRAGSVAGIAVAGAECALALALWEWSRTETPLVLGAGALFAAGVAWGAPWRLAGGVGWRVHALALVVALGAALSFAWSVRTANQIWHGIFAKSQVESSGAVRLMRSLYRVRPDEVIRYAPVTRQSLSRACDESPTLGRLRERLLNPDAAFTRLGERLVTGREGEFGSLLAWVLISAFQPGEPEGEAAMFRAASEVDRALAEGRLPRRVAFFPLDPDWRAWVPESPRCFWETVWRAWDLWRREEARGVERNIWPGAPEVRLLDRAAYRRARLVTAASLEVCCVLDGRVAEAEELVLEDAAGTRLASARGGYWAPQEKTFFRVSAPMVERAGEARVALIGFGRRVWESGLERTYRRFEFAGGAGGKISGLLSVERRDDAPAPAYERARGIVARWYPLAVLAGVLVAVVAGMRGGVWDRWRLGVLGLAVAFPVTVLVLRAAFFSLLALMTRWGGADRYMACVSPLAAAVCVGAGVLVGVVLERGRSGRSGRALAGRAGPS